MDMESWNLYDHIGEDEDPVDLALLGFCWIEALYLFTKTLNFHPKRRKRRNLAHREYLMLLANDSKRRLICTSVELGTICIISLN